MKRRLTTIVFTLCAASAIAELDVGRGPEPAACRPAARFMTAPWWTSRLAATRGAILKNKGACFDLVLVGDSITHRWESKDNGAEVYPKLRKSFKVLNLGSGGDMTQNVIWRFENNGELDDYTAKVFAIMIGVNNGAKDPDDTVAGVRKIVGMIRAKHPESKILLQAILPHGKEPRNSVSAKTINPKLKAYAEASGFAWLDMSEKFLGDDGEIKPGLMMPDNLHPIKGGYEIWLAQLVPAVEKLIGK
jgi:lysophospholipase L1-like esterase